MIASESASVRRALRRFYRTRSERRPVFAGHVLAYSRPKDYLATVVLLDYGRVVIVPRVARGDRVLDAILLCPSASLLVSGRN